MISNANPSYPLTRKKEQRKYENRNARKYIESPGGRGSNNRNTGNKRVARMSSLVVKPRFTFIPVNKDSGIVKVSPSASQEVHRSPLSLQVVEWVRRYGSLSVAHEVHQANTRT